MLFNSYAFGPFQAHVYLIQERIAQGEVCAHPLLTPSPERSFFVNLPPAL
jgi:hypothetical protein